MVVEEVVATDEARPTRSARFEKWLVRVLLIVGSLAVLVMMVIIAFNVFGRWFGHPILGAIDVGGLAGGVAAAIALPYTARRRRNVAVDILSEKLPRRVKGFFDAFTFLLSVAVIGLLVYVAFKEAFYAASYNETTLVMAAPTSPVKFMWGIGLFLLLLVLIYEVVVAFRKGAKR
jgi:TRAP-type C4-dicarboxylate transport system permease small subunit